MTSQSNCNNLSIKPCVRNNIFFIFRWFVQCRGDACYGWLEFVSATARSSLWHQMRGSMYSIQRLQRQMSLWLLLLMHKTNWLHLRLFSLGRLLNLQKKNYPKRTYKFLITNWKRFPYTLWKKPICSWNICSWHLTCYTRVSQLWQYRI